MAKIQTVELTKSDVAGENDVFEIAVEYVIEFNERDRDGNVTYHETCRLIGDDTNVPGDIANGGDDELLVLVNRTTATNNQTLVTRKAERRLSRRRANEDPSPFTPRDELRAEVRMVDLDGQFPEVFAESPLIVGRF